MFDLYDLGQSFKGWSENIRRIGGLTNNVTIDQLYRSITGPLILLALAPGFGILGHFAIIDGNTARIYNNSGPT